MPREMVVFIVLLFLVATCTSVQIIGLDGHVNNIVQESPCPRLMVSASCPPCPTCPITEHLPVADTVNECKFFVASQTSNSSFFSSSGQRTLVDLQGGHAIHVAYSNERRSVFYATRDTNSVHKYTYDTNYLIAKQEEIAQFDGRIHAVAWDKQRTTLFVDTGSTVHAWNVIDEEQIPLPLITSADVALAVDEIKKYLFVADYHTNRLSKMNYQDLKNPSDVVIIMTGFPFRPRGLLTDKPAQKLYILLENAEIWTMNLMDDSDIGSRISAPTTNTSAFALSMCGDDLYYTDQIAQVVWKILKLQPNGDEREEVTYAPSPAGIVAITTN